jgi:hypothetical protein
VQIYHVQDINYDVEKENLNDYQSFSLSSSAILHFLNDETNQQIYQFPLITIILKNSSHIL